MSVAKPDTTLSDMHYVYVTKPFPHPQPKPQSVKVQEDLPPMDNMPINSDENEWQQAPDGALPDSPVTHDTSRDTLPGTEAHEQAMKHAQATQPDEDNSLKTLFMQALKQQQDDMAKGKMPAPPVDETQNASPSIIKGDAGGIIFFRQGGQANQSPFLDHNILTFFRSERILIMLRAGWCIPEYNHKY